jgi:hypothetical protein
MSKASFELELNRFEVDICIFLGLLVICQNIRSICLVVCEFFIFMLGVQYDEFIWLIIIKLIFLL